MALMARYSVLLTLAVEVILHRETKQILTIKTKIMKTATTNFRNLVLCIIFAISCISLNAQTKKTIGVLNVYTNANGLTKENVGYIVRSELEKVDTFDVMDRFEVDYVIKEKKLNADCNSKLCLIEIGKIIGADKMLSGSVELIGEQLIITFRVVDVNSGKFEKTQVNEFLNLPSEIKSMINITISEMFGKSVDATLKSKLTKKNDFDNAINNPKTDRLNCSGPRMGATLFTGKSAKYITNSKSNGGFEGYPAMFQFGYQMEQQYLNEGNFQALFEFIPMITGLDQGYFIPSLTIMNGLRNNKSGWEFAFGPTIVASRYADGYYENGGWHLEMDWKNDSVRNPNMIVSRPDSRGHARLTSGFVFAFGKTIKSGNLNIPLNAYIIPNKDGVRFGISFGYNSKKR
jgi:TolB-like protein